MNTLYSNGPEKDFVIGIYQKMLAAARTVFIASPFVTMTREVIEAATQGKVVSLLVGLNTSTDPSALRAAFNIPNLSMRYYTRRFHAKIYLFDNCALVGSSNLTDGGMQSNREATVHIEAAEQLQEIRNLCQELWAAAAVLTPQVLASFETAVGPFAKQFNPDARVEDAVGRAEPANILLGSSKKNREYLFLEALRRRVYEQFMPAFAEVSSFLSEETLHRPEWTATDKGSETNRFLNWVRLEQASGDEWKNAPLRSKEERREALLELGRGWVATSNPRITDDYFTNMDHLRAVFANEDTLQAANRTELSTALMAVHAFEEQIRFIKGGYSAIIDVFWKTNNEDVERLKRTLKHLLFGKDEFVRRLYDVLTFPEWKVRYFAESCALELSGTVRPEICPPMNGRSAKGLRYIGFNVPTS